MANWVGQYLGNYRLTRQLGKGGFGQVYQGEHIHLHTQAAIKLMLEDVEQTHLEAFRKAFLEEARKIANLKHPHILRVLDFGLQASTPYLVMDYAAHGTLLDRHRRGTSVPLDQVVSYTHQIAQALQYAHNARLIHRDVKPANILLDERDFVLLSDFGIATIAHHTASMRTNSVAGTAAYMAPEQLTGKPVPASDQYALAIMVYEWLCGQLPYQGRPFEVSMQHIHAPIPSLCLHNKTLSREIEAVVQQAMAKDPKQRFATILDFAEAFAQAYHTEQCAVSPSPTIVPQMNITPAMGTRLFAYKQFGEKVNAVAWSPDGKRVISAGGEPTIRIWDASTGQELLTFRSSSYYVHSVAWSPNGQLIASGGYTGLSKGIVDIWEATSGKLVCRYEGHSKAVHSVAWSHDGGFIASASDDKTVQIWEATSGGLMHRYEGHSKAVHSVAWSPHRVIASASDDKTVQIWEATSGGLMHRHEEHSDRIYAVAWSPDGTRIACGKDRVVDIWGGSGELVYRYEGHSDRILAVAWSPNGRLIASCGFGVIDIWKATSGELVYRYEGHSDWIDAVAWSPNGRLIASGSNDKTAQVWEATSGKLVCRYEGHISQMETVAWSPNGQFIASVDHHGTMQLWAADSSKFVHSYKGRRNFYRGPFNVAWSPNGQLIALSDFNTVQVWEVTSGKLVRRYEGHSDRILAVAWSPNGRLIASCGKDNSIQVWEATSGKLVWHNKSHLTIAYHVAWSPDGQFIASAGWNQLIQVWEATSGRLICRYEGHTNNRIYAVAWSPDGQLIASGGYDKTVQVWEATSGKLICRYEKNMGVIDTVAWSPDGQLIASASGHMVQIWKATSGKCVHRMHDSSFPMVWSPNGQLIASRGNDNSVQVRKVSTGKVLVNYQGHSEWTPYAHINAVAWSPDGTRIASVCYEVHIWQAPDA